MWVEISRPNHVPIITRYICNDFYPGNFVVVKAAGQNGKACFKGKKRLIMTATDTGYANKICFEKPQGRLGDFSFFFVRKMSLEKAWKKSFRFLQWATKLSKFNGCGISIANLSLYCTVRRSKWGCLNRISHPLQRKLKECRAFQQLFGWLEWEQLHHRNGKKDYLSNFNRQDTKVTFKSLKVF